MVLCSIMLLSLCHAPMCTLLDLHSGGLCVPNDIRVVVAWVTMHVLGETRHVSVTKQAVT